MPMNRSNYVLQKWKAIQSNASAPLERVLDGTYTRKDLDAIGSTLKSYDDLAYAIFSEGVRTVELAARERVAKIRDQRKAQNRPMSAKQLAMLTQRAIERAQKETLPPLLEQIRDIIQARDAQPEPPAEFESQNTVDRLAPTNEALEEFLEKFKEYDQDVWKTRLEQLGSAARTQDGTLTEENETQVAPASAKAPSQVTAEYESTYTGKTQHLTAETQEKLDDIIAKLEEQEKSTHESLMSKRGRGLLGMLGLHSLSPNEDGLDDKTRHILYGGKSEGKAATAKRFVGNTVTEGASLFKFMKSKYDKVARLGSLFRAPSSSMLGLVLTSVLGIGAAISALVDRFENFDWMGAIKSTWNSVTDWALDKVFGLLGIDRKKGITQHVKDKAGQVVDDYKWALSPEPAGRLKSFVQGSDTDVNGGLYSWAAPKSWFDKLSGRSTPRPAWDDKTARDWMSTHTFTPREAVDFMAAYPNIPVPSTKVSGMPSAPVAQPSSVTTATTSAPASMSVVASPAEVSIPSTGVTATPVRTQPAPASNQPTSTPSSGSGRPQANVGSIPSHSSGNEGGMAMNLVGVLR